MLGWSSLFLPARGIVQRSVLKANPQQRLNLARSAVTTSGVVGDFIVHDRPAGAVSGASALLRPRIVQEQEPTPGPSQGACNARDAHEAALDAQAEPGRTPTPLQGLSQTQQAPRRVAASNPPMGDLEEREHLPQELERDLRHQELEAHELELVRRSQTLKIRKLQL